MKKYRIATGTVTYALRGRDVLRRNGYKARVDKISSPDASLGCGYVIETEGDSEKAEALLKKAGIKILKILDVNS